MGNLLRPITYDATALGLPLCGFTTTLNPQYETSKIDLCGYHHPNYFAILQPIFQPFVTETNNEYPNTLIILLQLVI